MARFECKLCGALASVDSEPSKCPNCGTEKGGWERKKLPPLVLKHETHSFVVYEDKKSFGRDQFRVFGRDTYKYAGVAQFEIVAGDEAWWIQGCLGNPTPTLLNAVDVGGRKEELKVGDQIQVGPLKLEVDLRS
jgi:hypothetical protein